jgi:MFS family permease
MAAGEMQAEPGVKGPPALPFFYGWVIVVLSALAMLATLPGRTHGLGLITERLLNDPELQLDRLTFGKVNFWATMLGAAFCLPCGKLLDRFGIRLTLTAVTAALGLVVLAMTHLTGFWTFFAAITLTRGLGQSALSVVSLAMVGKWFSRRLSLAMGVYSILVALAFIGAFTVARQYSNAPWQALWSGLGWALLAVIAPVSYVAVRNTPEECGLPVDGAGHEGAAAASPVTGATLATALAEPAFWIFALATSVYGLVSSGVSLFNEDILVERGFTKETYYTLLKLSTALGLAGNFLGGALLHWSSLRRVMVVSMSLLGGALLWMPSVTTFSDLVLYTVGMSLGGGMMTVVFFTAFGQVFGRRHLGQIQGIAQMLTVFSSALGPILVAYTKTYCKSYVPFFYVVAVVVAGLALWATAVRIPAPTELEATEAAAPQLLPATE